MLGLFNALFFPGPVHAGVDSLATLRKFWRLIETATLIEQLPLGSRERKAKLIRPLDKKHLSVMKNGDIWQAIWEAMLSKGVKSVAATKLKGHADVQDVEQRHMRQEDRDGNIDADRFADEGVRSHRPGLII